MSHMCRKAQAFYFNYYSRFAHLQVEYVAHSANMPLEGFPTFVTITSVFSFTFGSSLAHMRVNSETVKCLSCCNNYYD